MISSKMSQYIVKELSKIINRNINFMNDEGIIIASTDQSRIGLVHEGAQIVLKTNKKLLVKENQFPGSKAGINLPVYFENRVIGVIGITATEPEILKMAEIIRKMTEILIKEQLIDERNEIVNQSREVFIRDWLEGRWKEDKIFSSRGWMLGLNVNLHRVAITVHIHFNSDVQQDDLQREQNRGKVVGAGGYYDFIRGVPVSYLESEKAVSYARPSDDKSIVYYDDLRLEMVLDNVPEERSGKFVSQTLNLDAFSDPKEIVETLSLFFACNQSINKTAERLFINKNTLQYRLIKIKEITGYDPRIFEEAILLYLGLYFNRANVDKPNWYD